MSKVCPFAYGHDGELLVTSDGPELLVHAGHDEGPLWRRTARDAIVGVATTASSVVAVSADGEIRAHDRATGEETRAIDLERPASLLASAQSGVVAVLGASGVDVIRVDGDEAHVAIAATAASSVALDAAGDRVAAGTEVGRVSVHDAATGDMIGEVDLPGPVRALCWNPRGFWIAATGKGLARIDAGGRKQRVLLDIADAAIDSVSCSEDGALVAVRAGEHEVRLFDLIDLAPCGSVTYERTVGRVDFGPGASLGIGLDQGDGNKIDLVTGEVHRTDPHEGRTRNRWVVLVNVETDRIADVLRRARDGAALAAGNAPPITKAPAEPLEIAPGPPLNARLFVAIGCVLLAVGFAVLVR